MKYPITTNHHSSGVILIMAKFCYSLVIYILLDLCSSILLHFLFVKLLSKFGGIHNLFLYNSENMHVTQDTFKGNEILNDNNQNMEKEMVP
jgi:bacteriorhodopsin